MARFRGSNNINWTSFYSIHLWLILISIWLSSVLAQVSERLSLPDCCRQLYLTIYLFSILSNDSNMCFKLSLIAFGWVTSLFLSPSPWPGDFGALTGYVLVTCPPASHLGFKLGAVLYRTTWMDESGEEVTFKRLKYYSENPKTIDVNCIWEEGNIHVLHLESVYKM